MVPALDSALSTPKAMATRQLILDQALKFARTNGLEALTIGGVASITGLSKSAVFAHVRSKVALQIAVIEAYDHLVTTEVIGSFVDDAPIVPQILALFERWCRWTQAQDGGCLYISGAAEFDDQPGPVRDRLLKSVRQWQGGFRKLLKASVNRGELDPDSDLERLTGRIQGIMLLAHYEWRFLGKRTALRDARMSISELFISGESADLTNNNR